MKNLKTLFIIPFFFCITNIYALTVTLENAGYEKINYFHFLPDNGDSLFASGLEQGTSAPLSGDLVKQLKNTKTYTSAVWRLGFAQCGVVDFNEKNDILIKVSGSYCSVEYF